MKNFNIFAFFALFSFCFTPLEFVEQLKRRGSALQGSQTHRLVQNLYLPDPDALPEIWQSIASDEVKVQTMTFRWESTYRTYAATHLHSLPKKVAVFAGGAMAAGKGIVMDRFRQEFFDIFGFWTNTACFDMDQIRQNTFEYLYCSSSDHKGEAQCSRGAAAASNAAAGNIQNALFLTALLEGKSFCQDGSMKTVEWHLELFQALKEQGYEVHVLMVGLDHDKDSLLQNVRDRNGRGGRQTPPMVAVNSLGSLQEHISEYLEACGISIDTMTFFNTRGFDPTLDGSKPPIAETPPPCPSLKERLEANVLHPPKSITIRRPPISPRTPTDRKPLTSGIDIRGASVLNPTRSLIVGITFFILFSALFGSLFYKEEDLDYYVLEET